MKSAAEIREKIESLKTEVKELDSKKKEFEEEKIKLLEKIALGDESKKQSLWKLLKKIADVEAEIRVKESQLEVLRDKTLPEIEQLEALESFQVKYRKCKNLLEEIKEMIKDSKALTSLIEEAEKLKEWKDAFEMKLRAFVLLNQELFNSLQEEKINVAEEITSESLKEDRENLRGLLKEIDSKFWQIIKQLYDTAKELYTFMGSEMFLIESAYPLKPKTDKLNKIEEFSPNGRYKREYDLGEWRLYERNNNTGEYNILLSISLNKPDWPS
jgi:DNA repair exonuclease SbcCD ATPase subunit